MRLFAILLLVTGSLIAKADAFGTCYHFYNCAGETFAGGFVSAETCEDEGGLSIAEGSYCENLNPNEESAKANVKPQFFGTCFDAFNCIGASMGEWSDTQCESMGGHSLQEGSFCENLD